MDFLFSVPFIFKILITLAVMLFINQIFKNLIISLIIGILIFSIWSGHSAGSIVNITWIRVKSSSSLFLMTVMILVIWLSSQMKETGVMRDMVSFISNKIHNRAAVACLPIIIGLLPMPGGALFSAPMIDDCDIEKNIPNILKTKINYWFRHVWEYWWPLYPGVLLAIEITGLKIWQFILLMFPMSIVSILSGIYFLLRKVKKIEYNNSKKNNKINFIILIMPILIVIFIYILILSFFSSVASISKYLPIGIGLISAMIFLQLYRPLSLLSWKKVVTSKSTFKMIAIVALVRIYGAFIQAKLPSGVLLMDAIRSELMILSIPPVLIVMLVPFISGLATGVAIGFIGASFPIVMTILGLNPGITDLLSYTVLAYGFGYAGMILSPVHICLVVTNEYFKTSIFKSILSLFKPVSVILLGSLFMFYLINSFF